MYQPYPGSDQPPAQSGQFDAPVRPPIPQSVTRAVQVMYLGAIASLVGIIIELLTRHSLRTYISDHATRNGKRLTAVQVADTYHAELVVLVVVGLIGVGLWIWMAQMNKAGKNWARITSTVLFGIETLTVLEALRGPRKIIDLVFPILTWLVGLAAIWFLWQRESSAFFKREIYR